MLAPTPNHDGDWTYIVIVTLAVLLILIVVLVLSVIVAIVFFQCRKGTQREIFTAFPKPPAAPTAPSVPVAAQNEAIHAMAIELLEVYDEPITTDNLERPVVPGGGIGDQAQVAQGLTATAARVAAAAAEVAGLPN